MLLHPSAIVFAAAIGARTRVFEQSIVRKDAIVGSDCEIGACCYVDSGAVVGDRVTIGDRIRLSAGIAIENDVVVGADVIFLVHNSSGDQTRSRLGKGTVIKAGACIGRGAVLIPGVVIGCGAVIGDGTVVTRDVPPYGIVSGNPGQLIGFSTNGGEYEPTAAKSGDLITAISSPVKGVTRVAVNVHAQERGILHVASYPSVIPFEVRRLFVVSRVPSGEVRGNHAHRRCHQFLICVAGSCLVTIDDGKNRETIALNSPAIALHLRPLVWGLQHDYSEDASLLVLASEEYDRDEYIVNYDEFLRLAGAHS